MKNFTPDNFLFSREHLSREEIQIYLEEVVPDEVALPIEYHLTECSMCRHTVEYVREHGIENLDAIEQGVAEKVKKKIEAEKEKSTTENPAKAKETPDPTTPRPPAGPERPGPATPTRRKRYMPYSLAATVVLLSVIAYFFYFKSGDDFKSTMDQHFAKRSEQLMLFKGAAGASGDFEKAMESYNNGDFNDALAGFSRVLPEDTLNFPAVKAYLADINLRLGNYEEARIGFEEFRKDNLGNRWYSEVSWSLARTYYRLGEYAELESLLTEMSTNELQPNRKHAQEVLKDLQRFKEKGQIPK